MVNPYASPAASHSSQRAKSRLLRMAGLTVCFCLGGVGTGIALFILVRYVNWQHAIEGPPARYALLAAPLLLYGGFGIAWLLAGLLFVWNRRGWGWAAIALGIAIPVTLNCFGP